jgi:type IV secretion system protein VirB8
MEEVIFVPANITGKKRIEKVINNAKKAITYNDWHEERFNNLVTQRNFSFILLLITLIALVASIIAVIEISASKSFDPFVISIDANTGMATVVKVDNEKILLADESLAKYFINKYLIARETYNEVDFGQLSRSTVRVFSTNNIFNQYVSYIRDNDPSKIYGQKNSTQLTIRSWSKLESNKYVVRFTISETQGSKKVFNKIAIVSIQYVSMKFNPAELEINPVGFQVTGYRVDNDNA